MRPLRSACPHKVVPERNSARTCAQVAEQESHRAPITSQGPLVRTTSRNRAEARHPVCKPRLEAVPPG